MEEKMAERDFEQEVRTLYTECPELRGESLPEPVLKACVEGRNLSEAYQDYADEKAEKQNVRAARRAPVTGVTKGGGVSTQPEDAFLRGFDTAW